MSFLALILSSLTTRRARSLFTAIAVAIGVGTVVTLGVVTESLRTTAGEILQTGNADFSVSQKGVADVLSSIIDERELAELQGYPQVASAVGALITTVRLNASNPQFIEVGLAPASLAPFGVSVFDGRPFSATAANEVILGYRAAENLGLHVGDRLAFGTNNYLIVGLFRTNNDIGNSAFMLPLVAMQAAEREAGDVTLVFVKTRPGTNIPALAAQIEHDHPELVSVRTQSDFGRADRTLAFVNAADRGAAILALLIGAVIVANTMLLSFFERTREFGLLRSIGWTRRRVVSLVIGEALILGVAGAAMGVGLSFLVTSGLQHASQLRGLLHPEYSARIFWRALYVAAGTAALGALYPALRAAYLEPLQALSHE